MGEVVFTVQGDSESEVLLALRQLCLAFGLEPLGRAMQLPGRARWMARAQAVERQPVTAGTS